MTHTPEQCPSTDEKIRQPFMKWSSEAPEIAKKWGVKFRVGPLTTTEHEAYAFVEADKVEAVRDFAIEGS